MNDTPRSQPPVLAAVHAVAVPEAARRHPLVEETAKQFRLRCGMDQGGTLLVAVSGGADSLALLLACAAVRDHYPGKGASGRLRPIAAHVHHHLRESANDELAHVAAICNRHDVPLHVEHVYPAREAGNLAASARRLRYEALARCAKQVGAAHVATAHHAEDQLETLLIALCRGAGPAGMAGMAWSRPLEEGVSLIRPLLGVRKAMCESLCEAAGITWCVDPTNARADLVRGRLRRDVLPVLESLWPDAPRRAAAAADTFALAASLVDSEVQRAFGGASLRSWPREQLAAQPLPVIAAGLRRAAMDALGGGGDVLGRRPIMPAAEAVADGDRSPRRFELARGLSVVVTAREVRLEEATRTALQGEDGDVSQ